MFSFALYCGSFGMIRSEKNSQKHLRDTCTAGDPQTKKDGHETGKPLPIYFVYSLLRKFQSSARNRKELTNIIQFGAQVSMFGTNYSQVVTPHSRPHPCTIVHGSILSVFQERKVAASFTSEVCTCDSPRMICFRKGKGVSCTSTSSSARDEAELLVKLSASLVPFRCRFRLRFH